jgi:hypothetical protein
VYGRVEYVIEIVMITRRYTCKCSSEEVVKCLDIKRVEVFGDHANLSTLRDPE